MTWTKQRRHALRWVLVGQAALGLGACGSKSQPPRTELARRVGPPACPLVDVQDAPLGVRVINRSVDSVTIFTDICRGHHRVGDITAGNTGVFTFPRDLVSWAGGVRLLVYRNGSLENFSVQLLKLERRLLEVEIPEKAPPACEREIYVNGVRVDGSKLPVAREQIARVDVIVKPELDPDCFPLDFITVSSVGAGHSDSGRDADIAGYGFRLDTRSALSGRSGASADYSQVVGLPISNSFGGSAPMRCFTK